MSGRFFILRRPRRIGTVVYAFDLESRTTHRVKSASNAYTRSRRRLTADAWSSLSSPDSRPVECAIDGRDRWPGRRHADSHSHAARRCAEARTRLTAVSSTEGGTDAIWKHEGSADARELWSGQEGRVIDGPALSADGQRVAFTVQSRGSTWLYLMNSDGSGARRVAQELDVRGTPAWSPDGKWIAIAALHGGEPRLFKLPDTGDHAVALTDEYALDPIGHLQADSWCTRRPTSARSSRYARSTPMARPTRYRNSA